MNVFKNKLNKTQHKKLDSFVKFQHQGGARPKGVNMLGSGSYATVFTFAKDLVVRYEDDAEHNNGHHKFMTDFVVRKRSKYVPKVFYYGTDDAGNSYTVMERLKVDTEKAQELLEHDCGCDQVKGHRGMQKAVLRMRKEGVWPGDLHDENIMFRKDGTPVITDPIC